MRNFRITVSYDGSRYQGWQRIGNGQSIQGKIEAVLSEMAPDIRFRFHGAGRTDAGVHARAQVAHFKINTDRTPDDIRAYLNRYLPEDIAVTACEEADDRFHARLNATGKRYVYRIWNSDTPDVFERKYLCRMEQKLDTVEMQRAADLLIGTHDFKAFCGSKKMKKSTVRTLHTARVERLGDEVRLTFEGTGFLQNMVRILAGTLVEVGQGKRNAQEMAGDSGQFRPCKRWCCRAAARPDFTTKYTMMQPERKVKPYEDRIFRLWQYGTGDGKGTAADRVYRTAEYLRLCEGLGKAVPQYPAERHGALPFGRGND